MPEDRQVLIKRLHKTNPSPNQASPLNEDLGQQIVALSRLGAMDRFLSADLLEKHGYVNQQLNTALECASLLPS